MIIDFLQDGSHVWVWIAFSFAFFVFIAYKYGRASVITSLDAKIAEIKESIESAENMRVEAQELLAQYQRKQRNAEIEAEEIVAHAKRHAEKIKREAKKDMQEAMKRRERQLAERIARIEKNAIAEIRQRASDLTVKAAAEVISKNMDKKHSKMLVQNTISHIADNLKKAS